MYVYIYIYIYMKERMSCAKTMAHMTENMCDIKLSYIRMKNEMFLGQ